ncbi:MAG: Cys-tRNA(Pro) deacylase [Fretibacterium sp.]|nr:Cys-tRNA(Pro) deacylase [Fretibacterium sp.]
MKDKADKKITKTNAVRILEAAKARYELITLPLQETSEGPIAISARRVAELLGQKAEVIFKTLVTVGKSREHYVFVVPGAGELDLRKAARAVNEKTIEMIPSKELLPLTGYVHGGCSPVGMKKVFRTVIDASAEKYDTIFVSAGRIGLQLEIALPELRKAVEFIVADIAEIQPDK